MTANWIASTAPTLQTSATVKATEFLGKLHGPVIERKVTGKPGEFSRMSDENLERVMRGPQGDGGAGTVVTAPGRRVTH